jgi:WD40 repeat protein
MNEIKTDDDTFKCPLTNQYLINPVLVADGCFYEKQAIEDWLKKNDISPKTKYKLEHKQLYTCPDFCKELQNFYRLYPEKKPNPLKKKSKLVLTTNLFDSIQSIVISPDVTKVFTVCYEDNTIRVWILETGECEKELKQHQSSINSIAISNNGLYICSCSKDKFVRIWNVESGLCEKEIKGETFIFSQVIFSHDDLKLVSVSDDRIIRLWLRQTGVCEKEMRGHTDFVSSIAISYDGSTIISGSEDKTVRVWFNNNNTSKILKGHTKEVNSVAIFPDGLKFVSGSNDKTIRVWNIKSGVCEKVLKGLNIPLALSCNGLKIVSVSYKTLCVWILQTGLCDEKENFDLTYPFFISNDGSNLVSSFEDGRICITNLDEYL